MTRHDKLFLKIVMITSLIIIIFVAGALSERHFIYKFGAEQHYCDIYFQWFNGSTVTMNGINVSIYPDKVVLIDKAEHDMTAYLTLDFDQLRVLTLLFREDQVYVDGETFKVEKD